jgi:hypothetical protein
MHKAYYNDDGLIRIWIDPEANADQIVLDLAEKDNVNYQLPGSVGYTSKTKTKHDPNVFLYTNGQVKSMYKYHGDIESFILYSKEFFNIP